MITWVKSSRRNGQHRINFGELSIRVSKRSPKVKLAWQGFDNEMSDEARQARDIPSFLLAALRENQGPYAYWYLSRLLILLCGEEGEKIVAVYEEKLKCLLHPRVIPTQRNGKFIVEVYGRLEETKEVNFRNTLAKLFKCSPRDFILEDISPPLEGKCTCDCDIPRYTIIFITTR